MADEFTLEDLRRILRAAAGDPEGDLGLDGDIGDLNFRDLGYDSVALLETGGMISLELGIELADDALYEVPTPNALVTAVNAERNGNAGRG
jgi:minimal PKS acyl carrier protein